MPEPQFLEDVDEGIKPLVRILYKAGYNTFTSCEGGEGHAFDRPIVRINPGDHFDGVQEKIQEIASFLYENNYKAFNLSWTTQYRGKNEELDYGWIEIQLWGPPRLYVVTIDGVSRISDQYGMGVDVDEVRGMPLSETAWGPVPDEDGKWIVYWNGSMEKMRNRAEVQDYELERAGFL